MPLHSNIVDFALEVIETEDFNASISSSGIYFNDSFRINRDSLVSAAIKQQKKAKYVRFDQYDEVEEIPHINDFSQEEVDSLWWSHEEQYETRKTCFSLVDRFNAGEVMDKEEMLGLEKRTNAAADPVERLCQVINETVFSLQQEADHVTSSSAAPVKRLCRVINEETVFSIQEADQVTSSSAARTSLLIADFYENSCAKSALKAHLSALKLAVEVKTEICLSSLVTIPLHQEEGTKM
jgi:hypothetical protein